MKLPTPLQERWQALASRERLLVVGAVAIVLLALAWLIFIAPALGVLRSAETQHRAADEQLGRMRALQQQAKTLQAQPKLGGEDALRALEEATRQRLGTTGRIAVAGERVTLTLAGTPPDALAGWLAQARINARALPSEARLTRGTTGGWDGTIVLALPSR